MHTAKQHTLLPHEEFRQIAAGEMSKLPFSNARAKSQEERSERQPSKGYLQKVSTLYLQSVILKHVPTHHSSVSALVFVVCSNDNLTINAFLNYQNHFLAGLTFNLSSNFMSSPSHTHRDTDSQTLLSKLC